MAATLNIILESFILACRAEGKSAKTLRSYKDVLNDFIDFTGDLDPKLLSAEHIRSYVAAFSTRRGRHGTYSTHTSAKYYSIVRTFVRWMFVQRYIDERITDYTRAPRQSSDLPDVLTDEEIEHLFALLRTRGSFRDQVIFELFLDTGIRLQELANLDLEDIHLDDGWIKVYGKGKKEAIVPIGATVSQHLHVYIHSHRISEHVERALFTNRSGNRLELEGVSMLVRRVLSQVRKSGKCGAHILRHTFATQYLRNGGNLEVLRRILRHADIRTTQRYLHLGMEDILAEHRSRSPVDMRRRR